MYRWIHSAEQNNESFKMSREELLRNLELLDEKLRENEMFGEIDIYGGAVMCLGLNARESTHDIDAVFAPKTEIRDLIAQVAKENELPGDWVNDGVKGFVSDKGKFIPMELGHFTNLTVMMTDPEYLFAMKCLSCRMGSEHTEELKDIAFLIDYLGIESVDEAEEIILRYYPVDRFKVKTHYMLLELFD